METIKFKRPIRLRSWNEIDKKFNYWMMNNLDGWQQDTGLLDRFGKEIYEGDIVKTWRGVSTVTFDMGFEGQPGDYLGIYTGWCVGIAEQWETNGFWKSEDIEVLGNIYQNPELLKERTK